MSKVEMMFQHGWGLNAKMWKKFIKHFPECQIHFLDQGYFYEEKKSFFKSLYSFKVGIVHSLGLHLFPKDFFSELNMLIIFSSFINFHTISSNKILSVMKDTLEKEPYKLLNNFYCKAFDKKGFINYKRKIDIDKLKQDLNFLEIVNFDPSLIKNIPKILIFHGKFDKIIPYEKALEIKQKLENAELYEFESYSHMLPITHIKDVGSIIKKHLPLEEKIFKEIIVQSFSKQVNNYAKNNFFQKLANEALSEVLINNANKIQKGPILEIGCGTGDFTKNLIDSFSNEEFEITDICLSMVNHCKNLFSNKTISFYTLDGEKLNKRKYYSLIASSLAIQWFYELEKSFKLIYEALNEEGVFLFSFLEKGSFKELKDISEGEAKNFLNPLPSINEIEFYLKTNKFSYYNLKKESYSIEYPSILSFLQNLKNTGANASLFQKNQNCFYLQTLRKNKNLSSFLITYSVGIGIAIK